MDYVRITKEEHRGFSTEMSPTITKSTMGKISDTNRDTLVKGGQAAMTGPLDQLVATEEMHVRRMFTLICLLLL